MRDRRRDADRAWPGDAGGRLRRGRNHDRDGVRALPERLLRHGGGYEYPALLGLAAAALSLTGPGDWSLDAALGHRLNRPWMAAAGLLLSSLGSALVVARRRRAVAAREAEPEAATPADSPQSPAAAPSTA